MSTPETIAETTIPDTIDHVFTMRRSGNHAVIDWLKACYEAGDQTPYHINDVFNDHLPHLPPAMRGSDPSPTAVWQDGEWRDVLILSYEDVDPNRRSASPIYTLLQPPQACLT
ncbi:MAG TPA: hypothetical protein VFX86_04570, partial [Candidatus Saccharimonadales bacterium]|nr:hypothetical protein [Candidatus Saccharimonadales bacterium]